MTLNHQYNEVESLLQQSQSHAERHFELFLGRSRYTGWIFAVTICAATLVLFRVLMPFQDLSERLVAQDNALAELSGREIELDQRLARLGQISHRFELVQKRIIRAPWGSTASGLTGTTRELNRSYRVLLDTSNEDLGRFIKARTQQTPSVGDAGTRADTLPAGFQSEGSQTTRSDWKTPPQKSGSGDIDGTDVDVQTLPLTGEQLEALEAYFAAMEKVRLLGLLDEAHRVQPGRFEGEGIAPENSESDSPDQPAWMNTPPPSIADAIDLLRVSPEDLLAFDSFRDRDEFLFEQLQVRVTEEAHDVLNLVSDEVKASVIAPLRKMLDDLTAGEFAHLATGFEQLEASHETWKTGHESESGWYQTIATKGVVVDGLGQSVGRVLASTLTGLEYQSAAVALERVSSTDQLQKTAEQRRSTGEKRVDTVASMQQLLPSWFATVVDASELIQVFPMLLMLMLLVITYNVWLVRDHYLLSRVSSADCAPYTTASVWTLVRRGGFRTLTSLIVYLGGASILWFTFERSAILMTRWAALDNSHAWSFTNSVAEAAPWIGRAAFLAAAGGVILTLLWREQAVEEPEFA